MSFLDVFPFLNDFTFILFLVSCGFFVRIGMILMSEIAAGNKKRSIVTTGEKRYKGHRQRKVQTEGFFSRNASAKPKTIQWD